MNEKDIILNRCAFRTDAENESSEKRCKCPKIKMKLFHRNTFEYVQVCRNYYAELFNRNYEENFLYYENCFNAASRAKMEIVKDLFGSHVHPYLNQPVHLYHFQKINKKRNYGMYYIDNNLSSVHLFRTNYVVYQPFMYIMLDEKCFVRYPLHDIFSLICNVGIKEANEIFGNGYWNKVCDPVGSIIKMSVQAMVDCLESKNVRYRKSLVNPILNRIRIDYIHPESYTIQLVQALNEILYQIANNKLTY